MERERKEPNDPQTGSRRRRIAPPTSCRPSGSIGRLPRTARHATRGSSTLYVLRGLQVLGAPEVLAPRQSRNTFTAGCRRRHNGTRWMSERAGPAPMVIQGRPHPPALPANGLPDGHPSARVAPHGRRVTSPIRRMPSFGVSGP